MADFKVDYDKKEAERYSKLIISYLLLVAGIILFIGMLNITSVPAFADFVAPLVEMIALAPIWPAMAVAAQLIIENFWPLLPIYYGAHWVLKFEKKTAKA